MAIGMVTVSVFERSSVALISPTEMANAKAAPVRIPDYQDTLPRGVVAKSSNAKSDKLDKALEHWMPEQLVSDPDFEFGDYQDRWKLLEIIRKHKGEEGVKQLTLILNEILSSITPAARSYVKGIIKQ